MATESNSGPVYQFGVFEVDPLAGELRKHGVKIKLQDQPLKILLFLLENAGQVVTREQIQKKLWPDDTYVEYENAINGAVRKLRDALNDSADSPRFIETLTRRGYRFIVPVAQRGNRIDPERWQQSTADLSRAPTELKEEPESGGLPPAVFAGAGQKFSRRLVWVFGLPILVTCAMAMWFARTEPAPIVLRTIPLTTYPGVEKDPSLSPDGSQVAFSWNGEKQDNDDIYVKAIGPGPPLRLTNDLAADTAPAWSPDGSSIAFLRNHGAGRFSVHLIPALGGPERKLAEVSIPDIQWMSGPFLSWFPDSQWLVITDNAVDTGAEALFGISIRTGEKRQLTFPPTARMGDSCTAVSPDGTTLAFCRSGSLGEWSGDIYVWAIGHDLKPHGEARRITFAGKKVRGIAWSADSRRLVYSLEGSLWTVTIPRGVERTSAKLATLDAGGFASWPVISRQSARLAYSRWVGGDSDIWRLQLVASGEAPGKPERLIASTRNEFAQQYSPDGKKIAFESSRSGNLEIWVCDSEGANCTQLTWIGSAYTGIPTWSPDGRQIAFYTRVEGKSQIFVVGSDGGPVRRLMTETSNAFYPMWSRDGQWVYFASNRTGVYQVWKVPSQGGTAMAVTRQGGFAMSESPDGKWLYYTKSENLAAGLWRMPLAGGEETQVVESIVLHNFALVEAGVYFIAKSGRGLTIQFLDPATGIKRTIAPVGVGYVGFSVSPDRKYILYTQNNPESSELTLVENFR